MKKKEQERPQLTKENWVARFNLIGRPKITDFTFKLDEQSTKSAYMYSRMNLGIDCGEKYGLIFTDTMGGYKTEGESTVLYAHGKDDNGKDDFTNQITVDWEDRFDEDVLDSIGDLSFFKVGLEKTKEGKTFTKKFLSQYDAIQYIAEHIDEDMVVNVSGILKFSEYQGRTQMKKEINSIFLSKVTDEADFKATFKLSVLINKDSASLSKENIDTDKGVMYVSGYVLDYVKELYGVNVSGQYPFAKDFEFKMDFSNQERCKKIVSKLFKVKKGYTQINFDGEFIEGGAVVATTWDDVPEDIKELVEDYGLMTKEEALAKCATGGNREQRMVLISPSIKPAQNENELPSVQIFADRYSDDDIELSIIQEEREEINDMSNVMSAPEDSDDDSDSDDETKDDTVDDDMSWLDNL